MTPSEVERFFSALSKIYGGQVTVMLTGAAAGSLMGSVRPSMDVDFAAVLPTQQRGGEAPWGLFEEAVRQAVRQTGIAANFSADLDRWSSITLLDYAKQTQRYKRIGRLELRFLKSSYWAIGKLARYIQSDVQDLRRVLRTQQPAWRSAVRLWGKALRKSPRSTACFQFRQHVEHFLKRYGREVWGSSLEPSQAIEEFHRTAGIR